MSQDLTTGFPLVIIAHSHLSPSQTGYRPPATSVGKTRAILSDGHSLLVNRKRLAASPAVDESKRRKLESPSWFPTETVVPIDSGAEDESWWTEAAPTGPILPCEPPAPALSSRTLAKPDRTLPRASESLSHRISQNITLMHNMRETASLLSAIASGSVEDHPAAEKDLKDHSMRVREFKRGRTRSDKVVDEGVASSQLRMATGVMLTHAGFEGCNSMALDFVTRIASDYLMGLGKTAMLITDRVTQKDYVPASVSASGCVCYERPIPADLFRHVATGCHRHGAWEQRQRLATRTRQLRPR